MAVPQRRQRAWHEVGHSAVAFVEGIPVLSISICPQGPYQGFCEIDDKWLRDRLRGSDCVIWAKKFIRFQLAGPVAETQWLTANDRAVTLTEEDTWQEDYRKIGECAQQYLGASKDSPELKSIFREAKSSVERHIQSAEIQSYINRVVAIIAAAKITETANYISGTQAEAIWKACQNRGTG
jgi:hypothetical protein